MSLVVSQIPENCPRCGGRMIPEDDRYGEFGTCIQCGFVYELIRQDPMELLAGEWIKNGKQRRREPSHVKMQL